MKQVYPGGKMLDVAKYLDWVKANKEKVGLALGVLLLVVGFKVVFGGHLIETAIKMVGAGAVGYNLKGLKAKLMEQVNKVL